MNHCLLFNIVTIDRLASNRTNGVYRVAHILRQNNWDVEVIDFALDWSLDELKAIANSRVTSNTKFFGTSHIFGWWEPSMDVFFQWAKDKWGIKVISGSSTNPLYNSSTIDYYIQGFGENAILAVLKWLFSNGERPRFWYNTGKRILNANVEYPALPMKDLTVLYEARDFIQPEEWLSVEFARGCLFKCDFCNFPLLGVKEDTSRDADNFDLEMRINYDKWGVENYTVSDETFNDRPSKISKFADVVEKLPFEPFFSGFVRADLLVNRPKDRIDLARMNFRGHHYGVESFNHASASSVGKKFDSEKLKAGLIEVRKYFKETGNGLFRGTLSLIVGLPHETFDTLLDTRQWLINNWNGESLVIYPLLIPNHELEEPSAMSDYTKWGYRLMDAQEYSKRLSTIDNEFHWKHFGHEGLQYKETPWAHDNMNILDAREFIFEHFYNEKFFKEMNYLTANYDMGSFGYGKKNVQQRLNSVATRAMYYNPSDAFMFDTTKRLFVENYKQRKLSL